MKISLFARFSLKVANSKIVVHWSKYEYFRRFQMAALTNLSLTVKHALGYIVMAELFAETQSRRPKGIDSSELFAHKSSS